MINPTISSNNKLIIGDVHGDYKRLITLLNKVDIKKDNGKWSNPKEFFIIFLGDLNDPRLSKEEENRKEMSSLKVIEIAYELWLLGIAEVLRSNHQVNLINLFKGKRVYTPYGLNFTKEEMESMDKSILSIYIDWLDSRPYFYRFIDVNQRDIVCVHAAYTPGMHQYNPTPEAINNAVYGLSRKSNEDKMGKDRRVKWWVDYKDNPFIISGHYHTFFKSPYCLIMDDDCGCDNGNLLGYIPNTDTIIKV